MNATGDELMEMGEVLFNYAEYLFMSIGAGEDFCLQCVGSVVVFGGRNRLLWSPNHGFRCDSDYCTKNFIANMQMVHGIGTTCVHKLLI